MSNIKIKVRKNNQGYTCFDVYDYMKDIGFVDSEDLESSSKNMHIYDFFQIHKQVGGYFDDKRELYDRLKSMMDAETFDSFVFELFSDNIDNLD